MSIFKGLVFTFCFLALMYVYVRFVPDGFKKAFNVLVSIFTIFGFAIYIIVRGKVYNDF